MIINPFLTFVLKAAEVCKGEYRVSQQDLLDKLGGYIGSLEGFMLTKTVYFLRIFRRLYPANSASENKPALPREASDGTMVIPKEFATKVLEEHLLAFKKGDTKDMAFKREKNDSLQMANLKSQKEKVEHYLWTLHQKFGTTELTFKTSDFFKFFEFGSPDYFQFFPLEILCLMEKNHALKITKLSDRSAPGKGFYDFHITIELSEFLREKFSERFNLETVVATANDFSFYGDQFLFQPSSEKQKKAHIFRKQPLSKPIQLSSVEEHIMKLLKTNGALTSEQLCYTSLKKDSVRKRISDLNKKAGPTIIKRVGEKWQLL